jgi:hypothetical protein
MAIGVVAAHPEPLGGKRPGAIMLEASDRFTPAIARRIPPMNLDGSLFLLLL